MVYEIYDRYQVIYIYISNFSSSPFHSLSLLVGTQIRGHIAGSSPPLSLIINTSYQNLPFGSGDYPDKLSPSTHYGSCLAFLFSRQDFRSFFPRRLASNSAYPRQALSAVYPFPLFSQKISESRHGRIRTHGQHQQHSRATTIVHRDNLQAYNRRCIYMIQLPEIMYNVSIVINSSCIVLKFVPGITQYDV